MMADRHGADYRGRRGIHEIKIVNRNGSLVDSWPESSLESITWELNEPGSARIKFPINSERSRLLRLVNTELQVWRRGGLWWWGVPWRIAGSGSSLTLECEGLLSYFNSRYLTNTSLEYSNLEQFMIAWNLLSYAQQGTGKDLNITAWPWVASGVNRYRLYKRDEHPSIFSQIQEFPDIDRGFDYEIVAQADGQRLWRPYYPRKGTDHNNILLETGGNIIGVIEYAEDALDMAQQVYVTGGISGDIKFEANYTDPTHDPNDVLLQAIISDGTTLDVDWLGDKAKEEVERRRTPKIIPGLKVRNNPSKLVDLLKTGDRVPIYLDSGRVQIDGMYRIERIVYYPNETMDLHFSEYAA